jgi:hypothetical protein
MDGIGDFGGMGDVGFGGMGIGDPGIGVGDFGGFGLGDDGSFGDASASTAFGDVNFNDPGNMSFMGQDLSFDSMPDSFANSMGFLGNDLGFEGNPYGDVSFSSNDTTSVEDALAWLGKLQNNPFAKALTGVLGKANPAFGMVNSMLGLAGKGAQGTTQGNTAMGTQGFNTAMGMMGVPGLAAMGLNAAFGNPVGNALAGVTANQGMSHGDVSTATNSGNSGMGLADTALGLAGALYGNHRAGQQIGAQQGSLNNMFGQNSPYAQALRQQLERRDAAGGRRSQYGPREVELQAQLAKMASGMAPAQAQLMQMRDANRQRMLQSLGLGVQQMGGLGGIYSQLQNWMQPQQGLDMPTYGSDMEGASNGFDLSNLFQGNVEAPGFDAGGWFD